MRASPQYTLPMRTSSQLPGGFQAVLVWTCLLAAGHGGQTPVQTPQEALLWQEDLADLSFQMETRHPDLFNRVDQETFQKAVSDLNAEIPFLSDPQIITRLMTIAAIPRDGHTSLNPFGPESRFFPLHLYLFSDGLFVVDARPPYEGLIGKELIRIGDKDVRDAILAVLPTIQADNSMTGLSILPVLLASALVLQGTGVIDDQIETSMSFRSMGLETAVTLRSVSILEALDWIAGPQALLRLPVRPQPLYLSDTNSFWFTHLTDSNTLFIQYNNVLASAPSGETLQQFVNRIEAFLASHGVDRTVVDLRHNNGGNNTTYAPFLNLLKQHPQIAQPDKLYVITGRRTFSAAQNFATALDLGSEAIFAGEPSGGSPNHYGDSVTTLLPNSLLPLGVSSIFWHDAPGDARFWIAPDLAASLSSSAYFQEVDAAVAAILEPASALPIEASFAVPDNGVFSRSTDDAGQGSLTVGYAQIEAAESMGVRTTMKASLVSSPPAGFAAFSLRQNGVLISEASVLAAPLIRRGRVHATIDGPVKTGIAIANPGVRPAVVSFYFTDSAGLDFGPGEITVPANGQIARFLDEPPFSAGSSLFGTVTFDSDLPVGLTALRGNTNQRSEFLITALPVVPLDLLPPQQCRGFSSICRWRGVDVRGSAGESGPSRAGGNSVLSKSGTAGHGYRIPDRSQEF